jgi:hypothetical protein
MTIEIKVSLAKVNTKPPLRALADVSLRNVDGEITIRRCAVFEKPGTPPWANLPPLTIQKNGSRQFVLLIDLSPKLKKQVLDKLLAEYRSKVSTW